MGVFPLSLTGVAQEWYHRLPSTVQSNWHELCEAFAAQYAYNSSLDVSLRDLEMTKQKYGETFADFLIRWRNKASLLKDRPSERDQVRIVVKNVLPNIARILKGMNPQTFQKVYDDGICSEEIAEEEKQSQKGKATYHRASTSNTRTANVNRVVTNRRFSNFN